MIVLYYMIGLLITLSIVISLILVFHFGAESKVTEIIALTYLFVLILVFGFVLIYNLIVV